MTCVVGIAHKGKVYLGGDSVCTGGDGTAYLQREPKVFTRDEYVIGYAGLGRWCALLRCVIRWTKPTDELDRYLNTTVAAELRQHVRDENLEITECAALVGIRGRLYRVDGDLEFWRVRDNFDAIGSGAPEARGALYVDRHSSPRVRLENALKASEKFNVTVRRPWTWAEA